MTDLFVRRRLFSKPDGFHEICHKEAIDFLLPRHYSGRPPIISFAFGAYECGRLVAVCTYGKPGSPMPCLLCGEENSSQVYELNRLCREKDYDKPLSQFVAWTLKQLSARNLIIISYSDMGMNHHGYIYQACNFLYTGLTESSLDLVKSIGAHARSVKPSDREHAKLLKVRRTEKHRYVYFACDKRHRKAFRAALTYPVLPYPKGDNDEDYNFGFVYKPIVVED